jgi:adenylosuccinate synthase
MSAAAITKLDILDEYPVIRVCVGYRLDGKLIDFLPASVTDYGRCEPIWEEMAGWASPSGFAQTIDDLPPNARRYLDRLSALIDCPIELIRLGKHRGRTIATAGVFASA